MARHKSHGGQKISVVKKVSLKIGGDLF